jgi:hypothetical protein
MPEIDQKKIKLSLRPQTNSNSKTAYSPESPASNSRFAGLPTKCPFCRSEDLEIKPHHYHPAQVRCCSCGRWVKFLSKDVVAAIGFQTEPEELPQQLDLWGA